MDDRTRADPSPVRAGDGRQHVRWTEAALALACVAGVSLVDLDGLTLGVASVAAAWLWRRTRPDAVAGAAAPAAPAADAGADGTWAPETLSLRFRALRSLPELHLRGVEAELQWQAPGRPTLAPADWPAELPAAVRAQVLRAWIGPAMDHFARWLPALRARGGATLWLRLPPALLAADELPQCVLDGLRSASLDPSTLVLRVPLQVSGRTARLPESARLLQAQGVTLAVDAFGAGTASLTHLERLPVRTVCLAPSFVARAGVHTPQRWVVESTARLAQSMGMSTLAEGVSQDHQVLALAAMGCSLGVGDICGAWLDADDWARRWTLAADAQAA